MGQHAEIGLHDHAELLAEPAGARADLGGLQPHQRGLPADHLLGRIAEPALGFRVEHQDLAVAVGGDDHIGGAVQHRLVQPVRARQSQLLLADLVALLVDLALEGGMLHRRDDGAVQEAGGERGLDDVVLRAPLHRLDRNRLVAEAGEHDHRQKGVDRMNAPQHLQPVQRGERIVEQHAVGALLLDHGDAGRPLARLHALPALVHLLQRADEGLAVVGIVVDDQHRIGRLPVAFQARHLGQDRALDGLVERLRRGGGFAQIFLPFGAHDSQRLEIGVVPRQHHHGHGGVARPDPVPGGRAALAGKAVVEEHAVGADILDRGEPLVGRGDAGRLIAGGGAGQHALIELALGRILLDDQDGTSHAGLPFCS